MVKVGMMKARMAAYMLYPRCEESCGGTQWKEVLYMVDTGHVLNHGMSRCIGKDIRRLIIQAQQIIL